MTVECRCCGREVFSSDREPIHTACISKHWASHKSGKSASRCREFGKHAHYLMPQGWSGRVSIDEANQIAATAAKYGERREFIQSTTNATCKACRR